MVIVTARVPRKPGMSRDDLPGISLTGTKAETMLFLENGAAYVTRTRDPIITNDVLYQLS